MNAVESSARALLAFWRAAGVDMDEAEAIFVTGASPRAAAPTAVKEPLGRPPLREPAPPKIRRAATADAPVENARALAAAADSIPALRAAIESFDGCALKKTARNTVFSDGNINAEVLLIGEAPGKDEDEQGKPFVGRSGQMLNQMLAAIGLNRQDNILISNTIYWRPPGNRDPTPGETATCLPFVERLIMLMQPKLLILAGKAAGNTVLRRDEAVSRMRGRRLQYNREGIASPINTMVMLHPAYLLRQPQQKRQAWTDLLLAEAWLDELGVARSPHR
ncbi:MAG: uracil-DNA glycosylase [Terricaulis sp.]